jgi:hypothetical protein
MRWILVIALTCMGLQLAGAESPAASSGIVVLRGFSFDFRLINEKKKESILPSLNTQIDIVERSQVPPHVMEFFRTIPIIIDPKLSGTKGHAQRLEGQQIVTLQDEKLPSDRPILLHELLHGYFAVNLRGHTPIIPRMFHEAQTGSYYPDRFYKAHFMENPNEYFTIVSSIFLFGKKIDQPPYDCALVRKHQPEFLAFLETQFGPHECK